MKYFLQIYVKNDRGSKLVRSDKLFTPLLIKENC